MINFPYVLPRLIRHFLPEQVTRLLLLRSLIIRPGLETRAPEEAAARYLLDLQSFDTSIEGRHILVFGYGGRFHLACQLLKLGADHVTLCEYTAKPDESANKSLLPEFDKYLVRQQGKTSPRSDWITLLEGDIREMASHREVKKVDIVLSTSVFEHLVDPKSILDSLCHLTKPGGSHLHYIDLRDHFFKFPFEMLTYPEKIWNKWLNPTSHLNRWRLPAYTQIFQTAFQKIDIHIFERDIFAWEKTANRVLPEFKTGDKQVDAVTQIRVYALKSNDVVDQ
jgi:SAM-dependent methyltransferase